MEFDEFAQSRSAALVRYGYVLSGNEHDAADLAQEALARLKSAWPRVRHKADPESYVRTTMARLHVSWWRRRQREHPVATLPEQPATDPGIERVEAAQGLWEALAVLPRRQRAVLVLRYYEHLTDDDIANRLGISRGTVRSQASRGLDKLRERWTATQAVGRTS
jgi:RNA polymerase sigma-70 factor (sigma-E family)